MNLINGVSSVLAVAVLAGCAAPAPVQTIAPAPEPEIITKTRIVDTSCSWVKPIFPAPTDVLADSTAKQINGHNQSGIDHGCWKSPTPKK